MSDPTYTVRTQIQRPPQQVFDAIVDEGLICQYFTDRTSGPLEPGETVTWFWENHGDYPVRVLEVSAPHRIVLELDARQWKKDEQSYPVQILFELESLEDGSTMLAISESGWRTDEPGLRASHENCSGWTHMAMCLKGYLEHGLCLR